jgi:N-acetylneuraminic acid mutarotase
MYVLSGYEYFAIDGSHHIVQSVLKFDVQTQTWSEVAPMPTGVADAGACVLGNDIYIFGGRTNDDEVQSTTYHFSTVANEWTTLAPLPEEKCDYGVCVLAGLIYLVGGEDSSFADLTSVHRFDPVANVWNTVAPMSVARSGLGVFVLDGSIYAVGGWGQSGRLTSMERFCVNTNRWSEVSAGNLVTGRSALSSIVVQLEIDLFDSLIAKATRKDL